MAVIHLLWRYVLFCAKQYPLNTTDRSVILNTHASYLSRYSLQILRQDKRKLLLASAQQTFTYTGKRVCLH